jgi:hypothetical protein
VQYYCCCCCCCFSLMSPTRPVPQLPFCRRHITRCHRGQGLRSSACCTDVTPASVPNSESCVHPLHRVAAGACGQSVQSSASKSSMNNFVGQLVAERPASASLTVVPLWTLNPMVTPLHKGLLREQHTVATSPRSKWCSYGHIALQLLCYSCNPCSGSLWNSEPGYWCQVGHVTSQGCAYFPLLSYRG